MNEPSMAWSRSRLLRNYMLLSATLAVLCCASWFRGMDHLPIDIVAIILGGTASLLHACRGDPDAVMWFLANLVLIGLGLAAPRHFLARLAGYFGIGMWFLWGIAVAGLGV